MSQIERTDTRKGVASKSKSIGTPAAASTPKPNSTASMKSQQPTPKRKHESSSLEDISLNDSASSDLHESFSALNTRLDNTDVQLRDLNAKFDQLLTGDHLRNLEGSIHGMVMEAVKSLRGDIIKDVKEQYDAQFFILEKENDRLRDQVSAQQKQISELMSSCSQNDKLAKEAVMISNSTDQYNRRSTLRILGVERENEEGEPRHSKEDCVNTVMQIGKNIGVDLKPSDIDVAHRLPTKNRTGPSPIIVKFVYRNPCTQMLINRKKLKNTGIVIVEDLTRKNLGLFHRAKGHVRVETAWSKNGSVFIKGENGTVTTLDLFDSIDTVLDIANKGP